MKKTYRIIALILAALFLLSGAFAIIAVILQ